MIKVSVIVPIYKVEKFIERCVRSLLEQTLQEVEYIFVDDATPDKSIDILRTVMAEYPNRTGQIKVLVHEKNKGLPVARNTGLAVACGEYIFHCDSDDYVEVDMLEQLYGEVVKKNADIIWCDWFLTFEKNERYMKQPDYADSQEALKAMLSGGMKYNVWNKLVKRSLYLDHQICFPDGYGMGEDMTMMMLFVHAKNVAYLSKAFYHYVKLNTGAFSQTYSDKHLVELQNNVNRIVSFMQQNYGNTLDKELAFFKLDVKFPFLISNDTKKYALWKEWYTEANPYILQNKNISTRSRWLQWFAWKNQFWVVRLYHVLLVKVVYGLLYK
mgnify:FL=1